MNRNPRSFRPMNDVRRRPVATSRGESEDIDKVEAVIANKPQPWYAALSVRVILALLFLFCLLHVYLWKIVYNHAMGTDHDRLKGSVSDAISSLYGVLDHL